MTKAERHAHWQEIIDRQWTSGMTIAACCRAIRIQSSYFYTTRSRLKERESAASGFLELRPGKMTVSMAASSGIHVRLPIPDHLERVEILLDIPEEKKICPKTEKPLNRHPEFLPFADCLPSKKLCIFEKRMVWGRAIRRQEAAGFLLGKRA